MVWKALAAFAALAEALPYAGEISTRQGSTTMLRFGCAQVVIDRLDPLVNPGQIPSTHVHQIVGGNAFNASMTSSDVSTAATCTTCEFSEDFSNYWTANLYFKADNGTYKRVPQGGAAYVPPLNPSQVDSILELTSDSPHLGINLVTLSAPRLPAVFLSTMSLHSPAKSLLSSRYVIWAQGQSDFENH